MADRPTRALAAALVLAAAASATAVHAAPASHEAPRRCIDTTFNPDWTPIDDHTILVQSGGSAFKVTTATCAPLTDPLPRISTVLPGGSEICGPRDARLYVSRTPENIPIPCFMQKVEPITAAQAKALEGSHRH